MSETRNLGDLVDRSGDPDRPLILGLPGADAIGASPTVMTRAGLDALADAAARGFLKHGLARGDRVAVLAANRPDSIAVMLGAMRAGIVPVPVNYRFPPATIAAVIADSGARLVLCDGPRRASLAQAPLPGDVTVVSFDGEDEGTLSALLDPGPFEPIDPRPDEAALFLYTSGSTGRPKGVRLSHASHLWVARTRMRDASLTGERVLIAAPLYHMNALALALLVCASDALAVLMPQFDARQYIDAIERYRCTWITAVPPMIAMMLREHDALAGADLSSVRTVRMGSAPVNDTLAAKTHELLPNARLINAYGTTEGGPIVFGPHPEGLPTPTGSVGYPHPDVASRLAGPDAPEAGVLEMRSPALMLGYHNRPDTPSPITADGFYRTGDVFRRDGNGFHYVLGRTDDMFVSGGENIFPGEVESVLETHPDILQALVVPVEDEIKGTKPVAFVVRRPGAAIDEEGVKRHALANAPAYQHPRRVWFLEALPLATTGKIDRNGLRARAEEAVRAS
ncbi:MULTISPECIES: class I adenylate-forming enzyme family protein [Methylobacterium]|uniref:Long-chain-fatty-acid--CoA ligase n=4 Tax=Pseudomonadota TaxID=1224 RepID=A0ABQ4SZR4_9HYPH|nr:MULTISPECIES: class I adenylate-forming enzyme family protein [Methylobacterium]PIU04685.1 MAG: acetyl-CoA synthetase [Methylobacterium sp. CG09_land_8_20_14_0_10_71_15]PIU13685.1 MAG: acetyl-CoA synthetase [Methylobacterium sp. CG08_land_8_20_14_0_20_71_15]GBU17405.1 2,3-dihydroxybenzoate-AMP ligase [Methylobacterium sp.]GJE08347.1 Long-chain-fatty-acid--CoA ligase [Methylobacterium jeotgali]